AEARAELHADAAVATDVERPVALGTRGGGVEIRRVERAVERHRRAAFRVSNVGGGPGECPRGRASKGNAGQLTDSRPCVNRPAWLFSARARTSSHSAISSKPSSRAVRANPGYISVYSYVSPSIADLRFASVGPTSTPVTGSPTSARKSK